MAHSGNFHLWSRENSISSGTYSSNGDSVVEETAVQRAIEASLQDTTQNHLPVPSIQGQTESSSSPLTRSSAHRADGRSERLKNVDAFLKVQYERLQTQLPPVSDVNADTYIYIDPPARQPDQDPILYKLICDHYAKPFSIKSTVLKSLKFFEKAFGPTAQHRVLRQRGLVNKLPPGIKYVVDLTPPNEGEDAVYLLTELSCSEGLLKWSEGTQRWNIAAALIGGDDDFSPVLMDTLKDIPANGPGTFSPNSETFHGLEFPIPVLKEDPVPLEYSPVRHRAAIERVLIAITGGDPKINSAPKLWTTFAIAKYFGIKDYKLVDYIIRWLRAPPNTHFLEVFPEVSLKIADGLENADLCRDTFAILVGEVALATACEGWSVPGFDPGHSVHGRKLGDLDPDYETRLQYASEAFRERITNEFEELAGAHMKWLETTEEYGKLVHYASEGSSALVENLTELMDMLQAYVRGSISFVLCSNFDRMSGPVPDHPGGDDLFPKTLFQDTWPHLLSRQRILTRTFWTALSMMQYRSSVPDLDKVLYFTRNRNLFATETEDLKRIPMAVMENKISNCCKVYAEEFFMPDSQIRKSAEARAENYPKLTSSNNKGKGKEVMPPFPTDSMTGQSLGKLLGPKDPDDGLQHQVYGRLPKRKWAGFVLWSELEDISDEDFTLRAQLDDRFEDSNGVLRLLSELPPRPWKDSNVVKFADQYCDYPILTPADHVSPSAQLNKFESATGIIPSEDYDTLDSFYSRHPQTLSKPFPLPSDPSEIDLDDASLNPRFRFFNLDAFLTDIESYINLKTQTMLASPGRMNNEQEDRLDLALTNTLVCLTDEEWKYLPLWAGGNDDGSGGVFSSDVLVADNGFYGAGPNVRFGSGSFASSSSSAPSTSGDFDILDSVASTSHHTSTLVNDGTSTQMDRRRVYTPAEGSEYSNDSVRSATRPLYSLGLGELGNAIPSSVSGDSEATADTWEQINPAGLRLNSATPSVAGTAHEEQRVHASYTASQAHHLERDSPSDEHMPESDEDEEFHSVFEGDDDVEEEEEEEDMFMEDESFHGFD